MGLNLFSASLKSVWLPSAIIFAACLNLRAAESNIATATNTAGDTGFSSLENSVVRIFSTVRYPDPYKPWTKNSQEEQTGSGVVIEGRRILTNAHVVNYANQVQIQANQAGDKISATVEFIAPGIDLAVLKLDDEKFFDTQRRVRFV